MGDVQSDVANKVFKTLLSDSSEEYTVPAGFRRFYGHYSEDGVKTARDKARRQLLAMYGDMTHYDHDQYPMNIWVNPCGRSWWTDSRYRSGTIPQELWIYIREYMFNAYPGYKGN